jgi:type II secretory pathway pseudopilin PulG
MRGARPVPCAAGGQGFTLVETLVAMTVLTVLGSGIAATLALALSLLRSAAQMLSGLDELTIDAVCGSLLVPAVQVARPVTTVAPSRVAQARQPPASGGLTLVEVLVALAIGMLVLAAGMSLLRIAHAGRATAEDRIESALVQQGLGMILRSELARSGGGLDSDECGVAVTPDGGRLDLWWREGTEDHHVSLMAGVDGSGRPALYRRRHPHPRQPWLEDVTAFAVISLEADARDAGRIAALTLEASVHGRRAGAERWRVELLHRPCLREVPP